MKIKEIIVGIKRSKNYQSYECTEVITIEEGDNVNNVRLAAQRRVRAAVEQQVADDNGLPPLK